MNISYSALNTFIRQTSKATAGFDVYSRNLSQSLLTAKYFTAIQKTAKSDTLTLLSNAKNAVQALSNKREEFKHSSGFTKPMASGAGASILSSNQPLNSPISFKVNRLASPQVNISKSFTPDEKSAFAEKPFRMTLISKKQKHSFSVDFTEVRSNKEALTRMASAINETKDFKAEVIERDDRVQLKISSFETGVQHAFTVEGPTADALGLDAVAQAAEDGEVEVDGETILQSDNVYTLEEQGLVVEARAVGDTIELSDQMDAEAYAETFAAYAKQLATVVDFFDPSGDNQVKSRLSTAYNLISDKLDPLGVTLDEEGLQVNVESLSAALASDPTSKSTLEHFVNISQNAVKSLNPITLLKPQSKNTYDIAGSTPFYLNSNETIIDNNPYRGTLMDMRI